MSYFSQTWGVQVRDEIVREFTSSNGTVDDNLAGLHEIRARMAERDAQKTPAELAQEQAAQQEALRTEGWRLLPPRS